MYIRVLSETKPDREGVLEAAALEDAYIHVANC